MSTIVDLLRQVEALQREPDVRQPGESDEAFDARVLKEQAEQDTWIGALRYQGNSVSWTCSKAKNYGNALLKSWDAMEKIGVPCNGNTHLADAILGLKGRVSAPESV